MEWILPQVEFMVNGVMPKDLSAGIVFSLRELQGLKDRIEAHGQEKTALKKLHKELRKQHASLNRERRFQEKKTHETENKYVEVQLLKFGQVHFLCSLTTRPLFSLWCLLGLHCHLSNCWDSTLPTAITILKAFSCCKRTGLQPILLSLGHMNAADHNR